MCLRGTCGACGVFEVVRGGGVYEAVAKAPHGRIGREEKPGISTILFRRSGAIGAFVADLDNPRPHLGHVLYQDIGDGSAGPGGDTRGLGLRGEPR